MKTIISTIMCLFLFTGIQAQAKTKTGTIKTGNSYLDLNFNDSDTVAAKQTSYDVVIFSAQHYPTTQDLLVKLDSISTPGATVALTGSKFGDTYVAIGSDVTWKGTTADTTIVMSNDTLNRYRYYKVTVTRTAGKAAISDLKFKQYFE